MEEGVKNAAFDLIVSRSCRSEDDKKIKPQTPPPMVAATAPPTSAGLFFYASDRARRPDVARDRAIL